MNLDTLLIKKTIRAIYLEHYYSFPHILKIGLSFWQSAVHCYCDSSTTKRDKEFREIINYLDKLRMIPNDGHVDDKSLCLLSLFSYKITMGKLLYNNNCYEPMNHHNIFVLFIVELNTLF